MKRLFYLAILANFLVPGYLMAQDTFYVSSTGNNSNPGTQTEPWGTLNAEAWTDNCTIVVLDEVYLDPAIDISQANTLTQITIKGGSPEAAIMALNDDEFNAGDLNSSYFFDLKSEAKLTLQDITLKNMNREEGNGAGGMIYVGPHSELIMENVIVKNSKVDVGLNCRGGAIWSEGKLTVINSVFENCKAFQGGAVYIKETEEPVTVSFGNTVFKNNQTVNGSADNGAGSAGAALYIEGKELNVVFEKCYFESNYAWNGAKNANGGGLRLQTLAGANANVTFSNCTMANNKSEGASGFIHWARPDNGTVNLKFVNNVFYKNRTAGPQANILTAQKTGINADLSGSLIFVNNTSIMNNTGADGLVLTDQTAVNLTDFGGVFDIVFVNNIMLDCMTEPIVVDETKTVDQLGWGWAFREADSRTKGIYIIKNNVHDGVGGTYQESWGEGFLYHFLNEDASTANSNKNIRGKSTAQKLEQVGIDRVLTSDNGMVPYVKINTEGAYAIDNGVSSIIYKGEELIPQTDIKGTAIYGLGRDLGAFEYTGLTALSSVDKSEIVISMKSDVLHFSNEVALAKVYSISGSCVKSAENVKMLNVSTLESGLYIVWVQDVQGNSCARKVLK